jgi:hypothetical protein
LIVFFAGHGHTEVREFASDRRQVTTGYLIPANGAAQQDGPERWLRLDALLSDIARLPPHHILVILDACCTGIALEPSSLYQPRRGPTRARRDLRSRRIITSAMRDQSAQDNGPVPGHSVFTGCLIDGFETGDITPGAAQVTGTELGLYLQKRVAERTEDAQHPDFGAFELDGRGDLVVDLVPAEGAAEGAVTVDAAAALPEPAPVIAVFPRPALSRARWIAAVAGLALLVIGIDQLPRGDPAPAPRPGPPPPVPAPAAADPCRAARDSVLAANPFVAVDSERAVQAHKISETEWYALTSCQPVAAGERTSKVQITADEAEAVCHKLDASLPSIATWKLAHACAAEPRRTARAPCAIEDLVGGAEELTSDRDDSHPDNPLVFVIGGSSAVKDDNPSAPRRIPAAHRGPVTGTRCARRLP